MEKSSKNCLLLPIKKVNPKKKQKGTKAEGEKEQPKHQDKIWSYLLILIQSKLFMNILK